MAERDLGRDAVFHALGAIYEYIVVNDGFIHQHHAHKGLNKLVWLYDSPTYHRHLKPIIHPGLQQIIALNLPLEKITQEMITHTLTEFKKRMAS